MCMLSIEFQGNLCIIFQYKEPTVTHSMFLAPLKYYVQLQIKDGRPSFWDLYQYNLIILEYIIITIIIVIIIST